MTGAPWQVERVAGVDVRITRGTGKPLLLLIRMASGRNMGIWDTIWSDLAEHYTVANFDLVGDAPGYPTTCCRGGIASCSRGS